MNSIESLQARILRREERKKVMEKEPPMKFCQHCEILMPKWKQRFCSNKCTRDFHNRID